jgi:cobalt-zinc-cadmium resistance protein CzcA
VSTAEVNTAVSSLVGQTMSSMVEGARQFDISLRWPARLRGDEQSILDIPLDIVNSALVRGQENAVGKPRLRLRDLVAPVDADGAPDPQGTFTRTTAVALYREQGRRLILLRLGVRGRAQAAVCAEAEKKIAPLLKAGYRLDWDHR